jgi:hypothetical protein
MFLDMTGGGASESQAAFYSSPGGDIVPMPSWCCRKRLMSLVPIDKKSGQWYVGRSI